MKNLATPPGRFIAINGFRFPRPSVFVWAAFAVLLAITPSTHAQAGAELSARTKEQIAAIRQDAAARTPAEKKIASQLLFAARQGAGRAPVLGAPLLRSHVEVRAGGLVEVRIAATVSSELLALIKTQGGEVLSSYPKYRAVYARVPLARLASLAERADVSFIDVPPAVSYNGRAQASRYIAPRESRLQSAAPVIKQALAATQETDTSVNDPEGDATHGASTVRSQYGVSGAGVSVGVLSDSVDDSDGSYATAVSDGYVSPVTVVPGQAGSGEAEGLAMLEIVHRLAPEATLYFASGDGGEEQMAENIEALAADGCKIIIDDIAYFDENPFQDGPLAQAVATVTAQGVLYFSCAANYGNLDSGTSSCWEGDFVSGTNSVYLNFDAGGTNSVQQQNEVISDYNNVDVYLFWAEPVGQVTSHYNLYETNQNGDVVQEADDESDNPLQHLSDVVPGHYLAVQLASGSPRFLHLDIVSQNSSLAFSTAGRTRGHNACDAVNSFCVAATPADTAFEAGEPTGPYPNLFNSTDHVETFSADGPRRMFFTANGTPLTPGNFSSTGGIVYAKPDFTAADGVTTSVPEIGGNYPFFGTSAATPHAGALAALLLSYNPSLTNAQVAAALHRGTVQITDPGAQDRDAGTGILLAPNIFQVVTTPPTITSFSPANGPAGTSVTITGTNLAAAVSLAFNGTSTPFTVVSSSALTAVVPAGATTGRITVVTAGGTAVSSSNFTLTASVSTPVISSASSVSGQVGVALNYQITATNNPTSYSTSTLPSGLGFSAGGLISGFPQVSGTFPVTITASNSAGGPGSAVLTITILPAPPVISSATTATAQVGTAFSYQITASNGPTSFGTSVLPAGLSVSASGLISGTPTLAGTYPVSLTAANAGGSGPATLTITVLPAVPVISSAPTAGGQVAVPFNYQITGSNGPTSFGASGLPAGLTVSAAGLISGTPTQPGTFPVGLSAANSGGAGGAALTLTILPAAPVISGAPSAEARVGSEFIYQITASNAPTAYGARGLPAGLSLNATTGVISGTPGRIGTFHVTLAAANLGGTGTAALTLTVAARLPVVTVRATNPVVELGGVGVGKFTITLSTVQKTPVVVHYTLKGTAIDGTDYKLVTDTKTIKAGKKNKVVTIAPLGDLNGAAAKTVRLTLVAEPDYTIGTKAPVKVKIQAGG